jgi:hypothetical protein
MSIGSARGIPESEEVMHPADRKKVNELIHMTEAMGDWDERFITDIHDNWQDRPLTDKQKEQLDRIYNQHCEEGGGDSDGDYDREDYYDWKNDT